MRRQVSNNRYKFASDQHRLAQPPERSPGPLLCVAAVSLAAAPSSQAGDWSFKGTHATKSRITKLETKEQGGSWGAFDLDGGIAPGETARMEWDKSANNQDCVQFIRVKFADGSYSPPNQVRLLQGPGQSD